MNTNENYISNQIAVYKNSKTLLEFQDKLKVAPITSYAHIHASGEKGADGRRMHSLIGVLMKDIPKAPGIMRSLFAPTSPRKRLSSS